MRPRTLAFALSFLLLLAPAAYAKSYSADHFDARIQVLRGGGIEVTETVVFRFQGRFTEVFRRLPTRRTDGIEVLRASMDGVPLSLGSGAGHYDVSGNNTLRVRWHFAPVTDSVHSFEVTYVARGVVQQSTDGDLFRWQALPSEHDYPIRSSVVTIDLPAAPATAPTIETRRVTTARSSASESNLVVTATDISRNGWVVASVLLPRGSTIDAPPAWQARQLHAATLVPTWLAAAGLIFVLGLVMLFVMRQGYDSPDREGGVGPTGPNLPDTLSPAVAGALVANGRIGLEAAMATLFSLAEKGEVTIVERPKSWGQRHFTLKRTPGNHRVSEYEQLLLDAAFTGRRGPEAESDLAAARGRVMRKLRTFSQAVERRMIADGLLDEGRRAVRRRVGATASVAFIAGLVAIIPCAAFVDRYGPWILILPGAILAVGIVGIIMYAAITPLSDEGIRRARGWRGFQKFVRQVTRDRATVTPDTAPQILPFAVATGLAAAWSSYLKKHGQYVPAWFRAAARDDSGVAFAYFVSTGGSGASGGGAGGSGAAGGGASGAH